MSHTAARPWWADVQHLRPDEDGGNDERAPRSGRFDRPTPAARRPANDRRATTARVSSRAAAGDARRRRPEPENWLEPPAPATTPASAQAAAGPRVEQRKERRTIEIRGQVDRVAGVAPVPSPGPQRRRGRTPHERVGPRPDKVAMWAVLLGLLLILVAAISSPGADAAVLLAGWL